MKYLALALTLALTQAAFASLTPGTPAPNFEVKNQDGKVVRLTDFKSKPVLIYFYPKDDTPGCTKEACNLRDSFADFKKLGAVVLGVSRQGAKSHKEFQAKHKLPFDLLADEDGKMTDDYEVSSYPIVGMTKRQSFLIGPDGKVVKFYEDVDPETHHQEVLEDLKALLKKG